MDQITLKNFRCFREEQVARMAPLTNRPPAEEGIP